MADTQDKSKHRKVKNPETFREKAIKASSVEVKDNRAKLIFKRVVKAIFKPIKIIVKWVLNTKIAKIVWKIIRKPVRIIGLILLPKYIRNSWKELKLVTWPNWRTSRKLTSAVIVFAVIFGVVVAIVDLFFDKLFRNILLK